MISQTIGQGARVILRGIVWVLMTLHVKPNHLTFLGFVTSIWAAFVFASGHFVSAGLVLILAGLFDMVDGMVARTANTATPFGAFFDSVMDRYSDLIIYLGLIIYYGQQDRSTYVVLVSVAMMGSVLISYTRARAECLIPSCKVGFLERPERLVLLIIGSFYSMEPVLWAIAVIGNWTVIHRILHTRSQMRPSEPKPGQGGTSRAPAGSMRYLRGTWRYDVVCVVILGFIFLTPATVFDGSLFSRKQEPESPKEIVPDPKKTQVQTINRGFPLPGPVPAIPDGVRHGLPSSPSR